MIPACEGCNTCHVSSHKSLGVHFVLMALSPVIILPVSYFACKEKISWQAVIGTVVAIARVAILFLA